MTPSSVLPLAAQASDVTAGAVLTLVVPIGLLLVAFVLWYFAFRRASGD
jgi:hypothetical protein